MSGSLGRPQQLGLPQTLGSPRFSGRLGADGGFDATTHHAYAIHPRMVRAE